MAEYDNDDDRLDISDDDAERLLRDPSDGDRDDRRSSDRRDDDRRRGNDRGNDRDDDRRPARRERNRRDDQRHDRRRRGRDEQDDHPDADDHDDAGDERGYERGDERGLREQGQRALDAMKAQRRQARSERDDARRELDELRQKLDKYESEGKSELQRLQEAGQSWQSRAEKAEIALRRREIAEDRAPAHATIKQVNAVARRLHGESDDDLYDDADELFAMLAPEPEPERRPARTTRRPEERLSRPRGGVDPEEDDASPDDPRKLADFIRNRGR